MTKDIRSFVAQGAIADPGHLINKQPYEEARLDEIMRGNGYVPVLDITPVVKTEFLEDKGTFKYEITVYGMKARDPWSYEGWLSGRLIPATPGTKLKQLQKQLV